MYNYELSAIEVLLNHLTNNTKLNQEIFTNFFSTKTFEQSKGNLFDLIAINNLITNYYEPAPFNLNRFINSGVIRGMYDKPTTVPILEPIQSFDPAGYIREIVKALKEENFAFDEDQNVYISNGVIEARIPKAWLYRLSEGYKRKQFSKLYFYNKNEEANITDRNSLIDYLRHTKTFLVSLTSDTSDDYDIEFAKAEALTNNEIKGKSEIKVEELIKIFKSKISKQYKTAISRYKLTDLHFIEKRAEQAGIEFYTKPLEEQKKDINRWLIEFINTNSRTVESAQEYLLIGDQQQKDSKAETITGLINLFFTTLSREEIDYDSISLTDLKIGTYMPISLQKKAEEGKTIVKGINRLQVERKAIEAALEVQEAELTKLDVSNDPKFIELRDSVKALYDKHKKKSEEIDSYYKTYNRVQAEITEQQKDSLTDLRFSNNDIMDQIFAAAKYGRLYLTNSNEVVFELYNNELGKTTFKASITIEDLLTLIENINYTFSDNFKRPQY